MKTINTNELIDILIDSILDEPYFDREQLKPKLKSIIKGFRLKVASNNYNAIKNPSETAKLIRTTEIHNIEKHFWVDKVKELVSKEELKKIYLELDDKREEWYINVIN